MACCCRTYSGTITRACFPTSPATISDRFPPAQACWRSDRATACSSFSRRGAPIAARRADRGAVTGWDISETSVANTREALRAMALDGAVDLAVRDWFAPDNGDTEQ